MSGAVGHDSALSDRYAIERELGRGGMGVVFLARDLRHDRSVAIKFLPAALASGVGAARFSREIRTLARLSHPHVLSLHDSGEAEGELYYVMPHVDGESLRQRLERDGPLRIPEALRIARQVADALAYAHARGVVHRDIKPENILLDRQGHAYVADFGIARVLQATTPVGSPLTSSGLRMGSPSYMSPEQVAGEAELDGRSDLYSLGCVLFEMLAGEPPFADERAQVVLRRHLLDPPPSLRERRADVSPGLDEVLAAMLAKAPGDRVATADALALALDAELARATGESRVPRLLPWRSPLRVRRLALGGTAVAGIAAVALWAGFAIESRPDSEAGAFPATSIAVLLFDDHSLGGELGSLARGFTHDLIAELRETGALDVVSFAGVARFPPGAVAVDSIARALRVGTILSGGLTRSGHRLRANVDIVDGSTGRILTQIEVERDWDEVLPLRDSLVADVGFALRQALGREIRFAAARRGARHPDAWRARQRARDLRDDFLMLAEAGDALAAASVGEEVDSLLRLAGTLDPQWLEPLVERAWFAFDLAMSPTATEADRARRFRAGVSLADSVLLAEPDNAHALEARGSLLVARFLATGATDRNDVTAARADLEAAVALDPALARAWSELGMVHQIEGDEARAARALETAYAADAYLESVDQILYRLFFLHYTMDDDETAARWCDEVGRRSQEAWPSAMCRLMLLAANARTPDDAALARRIRDEALAAVGAAIAADMQEPFDLELAVVHARVGRADSALALIESIRRVTRDSALVAFKEAQALTALGRFDAAVDVLERLVESAPEYRAYLDVRELRELRATPRFLALLGGSNAPDR